MNMLNIQAGIMGAAGYTGGELIRLLMNHPQVNIRFAHSRSHAGSLISDVHTDLLGDTDLRFSDTIADACDVVFLCMGHGESKKTLAEFDPSVRIIDLSQDFRIKTDINHAFVYGLPELNREQISTSDYIANPGCFATAIQLALLPLAQKQALQSAVHITCTTGSTGAGQSLSETSHFSWRENNLSVYKAFTHQHLAEISQSLKQLQVDFDHPLWMIPQRGAFTRGILACLTLENKETIEENYNNFEYYYKNHPFVHISKDPIDLKQVVNTNKCLLYLEKHNDQLLITAVIDNLLKGASGQAVQNMNIRFGLNETTGLKLKASAF
jgi:N-acetyl-gamma-glutamyl-phosphate reductase